MIERTRIYPVEPLARRLALRPAADRATSDAALAALAAEGEFPLADIEKCVDLVRARAAQLVVAAASDAPWALRLGWFRDTAAFAVLTGFVVYGWAYLA